MDQETFKSREKTRIFDQLIAAIRISQNASDMMDEAHAALLGINRTDGRCLDIIHRSGRITAGELAIESGLTTGAVTSVIDRLESAGYARRTRSESDRRKVYVEVTELTGTLATLIYGQLGEIGADGMRAMPEEDMVLVARFLRTSAYMNRTLSDLLREYAAPGGLDPTERLRAAKNFAARIKREKAAIRDAMTRVWREDDPDGPSGKSASVE
ncbi:MAG: MarR family transcriptional regulator [Hyphomicrobiaceae bacterium]|nr:MarR family transcriptional regulator [Hyphomicrobiaceae bacterium]